MLRKYRLAPTNDLDRVLTLLDEGLAQPHRLHLLKPKLEYFIAQINVKSLRKNLDHFRHQLEKVRYDKRARQRLAKALDDWRRQNYPQA
jgi:hypothetical protein